MNCDFPGGVWPTMITPFTDSNEIDYEGLGYMIEWYLSKKVDGLFSVCQSSEMFYLSDNERIDLARFVKRKAGSLVPVIASGHVSDSIEDQIYEVNEMGKTGVDAVILLTNRFALRNEADDVWKENLEKLLNTVDNNIPLGFYECPYPYKRIISPELLCWCASTGRFFFLKDTSCDMGSIREKLSAVRGSRLKIYNANSATLLESLKGGAAGYSGVMANFHPELYNRLIDSHGMAENDIKELQDFLSVASLIERQHYPVNAKYHMQLEGIKIKLHSRLKDETAFNAGQRLEVEQMRELSEFYIKWYYRVTN